MGKREIAIRDVRETSDDGVQRVSANVDGRRVYYESASANLCAAGEAFASAFLLPAMSRGARLVLEAPLSEVWLENAAKLQAIFHEWWSCPVIEIVAPSRETPQPSGGRTALFFTGGVDSFCSLLRGPHDPDDLVYVHGFDIKRNETSRFEKTALHLAEVAEASGKRMHIVATNLREHPLMSPMDWIKTHGGALASVGHILQDASRVVVSSSYSRSTSRPWGSHWRTDPLWSSEGCQIVHWGEGMFRREKIAAIAAEPLVQRHLRVCWEHANSHFNCCVCEKCIRTMIVLLMERRLASYEVFPLRDDLATCIRRLPHLPVAFIYIYEDFIAQGLPPEIERAVLDLIERTRRYGRRREFWRKVKRRLGM